MRRLTEQEKKKFLRVFPYILGIVLLTVAPHRCANDNNSSAGGGELLPGAVALNNSSANQPDIMFPDQESQVMHQPEPTHTIVPNQSLTWEAANFEGFKLEISGLNQENALQLFGQTAENWTVWGFEISFVNGSYYLDMIFNNSRVYAYRFNEPPIEINISQIATGLEIGIEFPSGKTTRLEVKLSQSDLEQIHFLKATQS